MPHPEQSARAPQADRSAADPGLGNDALVEGFESGRLVTLRGRYRSVVIGDGVPVKVNTSIGCSTRGALPEEIAKLEALAAVGHRPDLMMDLSIVRPERPLYAAMIDTFGGPVGTLPHYLCFSRTRGIDVGQLLNEIERQAEAGVAWMTLHVAVDRELCELAQRTRRTPITARGGGMVVADMYLRDAQTGIFDEILPEVLAILARHGTALSLGTTFRPASVRDALDQVHVAELAAQRRYAREARRHGVPVLLEAVGHMTLDRAAEFTDVVRNRLEHRLPIMTLGPIPTDAAIGGDHVAAAIGGALLASMGGANILNSVTREEHTGGVPSRASILEGLNAARVAAHAANLALGGSTALDDEVADARAEHHTCVVSGGIFGTSAGEPTAGCSRCGPTCPLLGNQAHDALLSSALAAAVGS
jgi:phosphomethylpyrimidine synthase